MHRTRAGPDIHVGRRHAVLPAVVVLAQSAMKSAIALFDLCAQFGVDSSERQMIQPGIPNRCTGAIESTDSVESWQCQRPGTLHRRMKSLPKRDVGSEEWLRAPHLAR